MSKIISIEITNEQEKALLSDMVSIEEWLNNFVQVKANQCACEIINKTSDRQAHKLPETEKWQIIQGLEIETAQQRNEKAEQERNKAFNLDDIK